MQYQISRDSLLRVFGVLVSHPYSEVFDLIRQLEDETGEKLRRTVPTLETPVAQAPVNPPQEATNEPAQQEVPAQATAQ